MSKQTRNSTESTRRAYLRYGGAALTAGLLAGCTGGSDTNSTQSAVGTDGSTATGEPSEGGESTDSGESTETPDGPYTVSMAPMGEVEFEEAPETVFTRLTHLADMAFALGRGNSINAMHAPEYYDGLWNEFVTRLPGVTLDWQGLYSSWETSKEKLYELDSDIHLADPSSVSALGKWNQQDLDEVEQNIGPWFGNSYSAGRSKPPEGWRDQYEYYTLWEQFEKVAQAFREEARYEALTEVRNGMVDTIESKLPAESDRPSSVMIASTDIESIYVYRLDEPGFRTAHTRPLGVVEAFGDDVESQTTVDFETMLEADPEVIFLFAGMHPTVNMADVRQKLQDDPVAREITAVQNDRVYAQGARYQGPILNLFQIEMTAKQLHPEQFGEWPEYETGPYPEISKEEQLFDRQRVADVINGNV
ncbi:ABC transporter substrate-binding protein [Haloarchaeobius sp. DFWS5]|uniref:ABC transporter substrate-binding protein n=1 Tax=Haloarchaeobius sp. DFWS5 TaxID=3446114 RepID=UPI003EBEDCEE